MKSTITITAVVLVHAALLSLIGCRSTTGFEQNDASTNTAIYSGTYVPKTSSAPSGSTSSAVPSHPASPAHATLADIQQEPPQYESQPVGGQAALAIGTPVAGPADIPASEPVGVGAGKTYTVKRGESLWLIAKREHTSVAELCKANGLSRNAVLREGQKITVPASSGAVATTESSTTAGAASGEIYVVQKGDVLGTIARKHGTSVASIRSANSLKNDTIRVGQKLRIPGATITPPVSNTGTAPASSLGSGTPSTSPAATTSSSSGSLDYPAGGLFGIPSSATATPAPATASPAPA
ncbi:MAG: LysM peptidoglycan-binding domain-containing protein, partial [Puniceicoccales bacterium]|nr:LysM peptidoglycan-binding domain-containing protein [Puniceicoccales bacterium]